MAASFKVGQEVQIITVIPEGPIMQLAVDQEGNIEYLVTYKDSDGETQNRWFKEDELKAI
jgi:uncharacterized protein YodC (DUF2158 family)